MELATHLSENFKLMPALCLDFDGTIRKSKSGQTFIKNFQDIELIEGMEELIWKYRDAGYLIVGVSNQAGVAHGFKLPMEVEAEMDKTLRMFKRNPFHVAKWCYHDGKGTLEPFKHRSLLRKPDIGILAVTEVEVWGHGIIVDWDNSLFVGDRPEDQECAKNAGTRFMWADDFLEKGIDQINWGNTE